MRIRPTSTQIALTAAAAFLMIVNIYFGFAYMAVQDERNKLLEQMQGLEQVVSRLQSQPTPTSQTTDIAFPNNPPNVELADLLVANAASKGIEVISLRAGAVSTEPVGQGSYRLIRLSLRLRADPVQLADYLAGLEQGGMRSMVVDNIETGRANNDWESSLDVLAYAQGG